MHLFTLSQKIIGSQKTSIYKNDRKLLICGIIWLGSLKNEEELYMTEEHYNTIYIDFTDEELALIDEYAAYIGEEREAMLQKMFEQIINDIKESMELRKQA